MTKLAVAVVAVALAVLGCGSAEVADSRGSDAEAGVVPDAAAEADAGPEAAGDAEPDAAPFPGCPNGDGGFLQTTFPEKRLSVGFGHACGIRDDGTVACWGGYEGGTYYGYTVPPAGTFVRVAAGDFHTCGIRTSGEVECWGSGKGFPSGSACWPDCGQSMPPPGKFIEITAGHDLTCGLRPDCTMECWGNVPVPVPPGRQFVQVDAWYGALAVEPGGNLWPSPPGFGADAGTYAPRESLKQVSLGQGCLCYVYTNHEADCWFARSTICSPPIFYDETWTRSGVAAVSCGAHHACAILEDGTVDCNPLDAIADSCGPPGTYPWGPPSVTRPTGTFTELSCGYGFCCGLRTDGTAMCFDYGSGASTGDMPPNFPKGP